MRTPERECPHCGHTTGETARDMRALLAVLGVVLTFGLAFTQLLLGDEDGAAVPPWAAGFLALVVNSYYMTKGAERHAAAIGRAQQRTRRRAQDEPANR